MNVELIFMEKNDRFRNIVRLILRFHGAGSIIESSYSRLTDYAHVG